MVEDDATKDRRRGKKEKVVSIVATIDSGTTND